MRPHRIPVDAVLDEEDMFRIHRQSPMRMIAPIVDVRSPDSPGIIISPFVDLPIPNCRLSFGSFDFATVGAVPTKHTSNSRPVSPCSSAYSKDEDEVSPLSAGSDSSMVIRTPEEDEKHREPSTISGRSLLSIDSGDSPIKTTTLQVSAVIIRRDVPQLDSAPRRRKKRQYFQAAEKSVDSPTGFARRVQVRSQSLTVPVPPPQRFHKVFAGCEQHYFRPAFGCHGCRRGIFVEHGEPTEIDTIRGCRSAPPMLVRVQIPKSRFESAVQPLCHCDKLKDAKCFTCLERDAQSAVVGASFF
ncbi:uncharacterized protein JN550_001603 [Neoarthrinium moseri]|uniref:uncharacterized protein n=1 Tax=Neoarthrinium moseri TaxID=1658444 RepID=UPI001FDE84C5|nr:uncharacterized protein JN550_001603 [Neoarthrinium moseri]KAI1876107.1 hypothetical protein JN550_001603 [Neoarthrinium moseri]